MPGLLLALTIGLCPAAALGVSAPELWQQGRPTCSLVLPSTDEASARLARETIGYYLGRLYGVTLPESRSIDTPGTYVLLGSPENNPAMARLAREGLQLAPGTQGEGFRLLTHEKDASRYLIVHATTPRGLKHGCQELVFYRIAATASGGSAEWPLDVQMRPQFENRAIYMLPCWAAHDSIESWQRVIRFNSELTLNRVWFWLNGFPLLPEYGGEYPGTDLARVDNVRGLIELCRAEGMKFFIGGGWFHWHHLKHAGGSPEKPASSFGGLGGDHIKNAGASVEKGVRYYLDMVQLLPEAEGIFLEPPGETFEVPEEVWRSHTAAMKRLMGEIWRSRPEFEFVVAIGVWNDPRYREAVHAIGSEKLTWWWCWGDPVTDKALSMHPRVLRWHTTLVNGEAQRPPGPDELALAGFATSYDPGMGFGRNGWPDMGARMGADGARNFDPYDLPYFSHQYWFRERCWNVHMTRSEFVRRFARRIFDADMPPGAADHYLKLAGYCPDPATAVEAELKEIEAFIDSCFGRGTPRNRDTLTRMREALEGIRRARSKH